MMFGLPAGSGASPTCRAASGVSSRAVRNVRLFFMLQSFLCDVIIVMKTDYT